MFSTFIVKQGVFIYEKDEMKEVLNGSAESFLLS